MLTFDWLTDLRNHARLPWNRRARHSRRYMARRSSVLPATTETLEDRTLLTQFVVTTLDDENDFAMGVPTDVDGAGGENDLSLREAILLANQTIGGAGGAGAGDDQGELDGDTIVFDPSLAGGTIMLTMGGLLINDDLTIDGEANNITIDADGMSRIFVVNVTFGAGVMNDVGFSNLTLTGGNDDMGGALLITTAVATESTVAVDTVTFTDNTATVAGGAIADIGENALAPTLTVVDSMFMGNQANGSNVGEGGGAIALQSFAGGVNISGSTFDSNVAIGGAAGSGGGAILNISEVAAPLTIEDSTFTNNLAGDSDDDGTTDQLADGGAILNEGVLTIDAAMGGSTTFTGNSAGRAGGAIENRGPDADLTLNDVTVGGMTTMDGNNADVNGGGLHQTGAATVIINGGTFQNNTAGAEGGGLWNSGDGTMTLDDTLAAILIDSNVASGDDPDQGGGGIFQEAGTATLTIAPTSNGITISNNVADGTSGSGGGIFVDDGATLEIDGTAAAVMITGNVANRAGGGIEDNSGAMTTTLLTNVTVDGNSAGVDISAPVGMTPVANPGNGGGLHITGPGDITIDGGSFSDNLAASEGGGLWNGSGTMTIQNGTIIDNNTASGAGADNGGGGIFNAGGTLIIDGTMAAVEITNNTADGDAGSGGGILNDAMGIVDIDTATISGNTANRAGGGIETTAGTDVTLTNVTLGGMMASEGNTALGIGGDPTVAGNGGGLHITSDGVVTIDGGTIQNNSAAEGGGLWNSATGTLTLDDSNAAILIDSNTAFGNADPSATSPADLQGGGGIFSDGGDLILDGSTNGITISNNSATGADFGSGGGILAIGGGTATIDITMVEIMDNTATRAGGGIEIVDAMTVNLTLMALTGNSATGTGAGPGNGGGLHTTGDVADLTIDDSLVQDNAAASEGGGLWFSSGTTATIQNNTDIIENTASGADATNGGGGIFNAGGSVTIDGSVLAVTISDNAADGTSGSGGGIFNDAMGTLTINDAVISGNVANRAGGGIEATAGTMTMLTDVTLDGNSAGVDIMSMIGTPPVANPGNGGGLHVTGDGNVTIDGGTVSGNVAASEGGGLWNGTGTMTIQNGTVIDSNVASGDAADNGGGGVFNAGGTVTITGATTMITNNAADGTSGSGGGIFNDAMGTLEVTDAEISGNVANRAGGGIEATAGTMTTLTSVTLDDNSAGVDIMSMVGMAPVANPGNGGGLHVTGDGDVTIDGGTVSGNVAASEGGGLWNGSGEMMIQNGAVIDSNVASGNAADNGGGGVFNAGGEVTIINSTISNNAADGTSGSGGGIFNDAMGTLTVTGGSILANVANRAGGGIETTAGTMTTLSNVTIDGNSAGVDIMAPVGTTPVAAPGNGGGLHVTGDGTVDVIGGLIQNNVAALEGGGLWNGSGTMTVDGSVILNNTASGDAADDGGGGIFNNGGTLDVDNATIQFNEADGVSGSGGGIFSLGGTVTIDATTISTNSANRAGGGIEQSGGTATLTDVNLINNDVNALGAFADMPNPGNGGGLHITGDAMVTIDGGSVSGNEAAAEGGGLWNSSTGTLIVQNGTVIDGNVAEGMADGSSDPTLFQGGGGIFNDGGTLTIDGSMMAVQITANDAVGDNGSGGGIMSIGGTVTINDTEISGNSANRAGGGIEVISGSVSLTDVNLDMNDVDGTAGTPAPGNGGGLHVTADAMVTISGGTVSGNDAAAEGGGLWNSATGTLTISNGTVIDGNSASGNVDASGDTTLLQGGGGIFNNGGTLVIDDSDGMGGGAGSGSPVMITGNIADGVSGMGMTAGSGGGILSVGGTVTITGAEISGNEAIRAGGGIEVVTGDVTLTDVTLDGNDVSDDDLTMNGLTTSAPGNGGGLHITGDGDMGMTTPTTVTIDGGSVSGNAAGSEGGGLWNNVGATLIVQNGTMIANNFANGDAADEGGGGIFNNGGTLDIDDATIQFNVADGTSGSGGGILSTDGTVTIDNTTISLNSANRAGGGIEAIAGTVTLTGVQLINNELVSGTPNPGSGGGLHAASANVTITGSSVFGNEAAADGGGLWIGTGTLTVETTTVDSNTADDEGGGIYNQNGTLIVNCSTLSANSAVTSGGAIHNGGGGLAASTTIGNSTISGNDSDGDGGGIFNAANSTLTINNATIVLNITDFDDDTMGSGGGIFTDAMATTTLNNTIVAGNTTGGAVDDDFSGAVDSASSNNLVGVAGDSGLTNGTNGNIVGIMGGLAAVLETTLADNGGPTLTHALVADSPAINTGNNSFVNSAFDQRGVGFPRVLGGIVDIGAVESVFSDPGDLLDGLVDPFIDPLAINGPYKQVVAGDFDGVQLVSGGDGDDDLFFWDPVSGENRIVLSDGTIITNPVNPAAINGNDFSKLVAGAFDGDPNDDLFFWDPVSGKNRLVHFDVDSMTMPITITGVIEDNVVPQTAINGNDFSEIVAGDLDGGDADDLFFWNPTTGRNRIAHLTAVVPAAETAVSDIQTNVVDVTAINGNDFQDIKLGDFDSNGTLDLFFVNLSSGRNRLVTFSVTTPGVATAQDTILTNVIDQAAINGNDFSDIVIGDVNGDNVVDVFARDFATGNNRLFTNNGDGSMYMTELSPVSQLAINSDFPEVASVTIETASSAITDGVFFWNPITGQNRLVATDFVV